MAKTTFIKFGTSGYRGIINQSFSNIEIHAIGLAIATLLHKKYTQPHIAIAYDPREGNCPHLQASSFTYILTQTLINAGISITFFTDYAPTPFLSWYVPAHSLQGGIILTASHNPPEYNGLKFNPKNGAPADPSTTQEIECNLAQKNLQTHTKKGTLYNTTPNWKIFSETIKENLIKIGLQIPKNINLHIAVDCKHGTSAKLWEAVKETFHIDTLTLLHKEPKSDFNHLDTNPCNTEALTQLKSIIQTNNIPLGIANDPDADRHIILDEKGTPLTPEETGLIILDFFLSVNINCHALISTLASSRILKTAAQQNNLNYHECNIGFKYIAQHLERYKQKKEIAFGIESSGGFSSSFHTLEKCGFLPGILLSLALHHSKKPLSKHKEDIQKKYGFFHFKESSFTFKKETKTQLQKQLHLQTKETLQMHYNELIQTLNTDDGLKINFNQTSWALLRFSGTEPVLRIYTESTNNLHSQTLNHKTHTLIDTLLT
ncbi:MAG: hypothetical protein VW378_06465 [bacterium]